MTDPVPTRDLDTAAFLSMLQDDEHIEALLTELRDRHTFDMGGPALEAVGRAFTELEMLRINLRLVRLYTLGAAS